MLEIGLWNGRSAVFLLTELCQCAPQEAPAHATTSRARATCEPFCVLEAFTAVLGVLLDVPLGPAGPTRAKLAMVPVLPVERVIYRVDADTLVRADVRPLWDTDLAGRPLGAVPDVGYPVGHAGVQRAPYFNAGVLLMDLARVRAEMPRLLEAAAQYETSLHRDQDALNDVFRGEWLALGMKWNAQGLGTYAEDSSPERDALDLEGMKEASIVHFTGPVNPRLVEVLNPYIQPCTAKPWGYAGAPGHPYAEAWWSVVELTEWRGWRASRGYTEYCATEREEAIKASLEAFRQKLAV